MSGKVRVSVMLSRDEYENLKRRAELNQRTIGGQLRRALVIYNEKYPGKSQ